MLLFPGYPRILAVHRRADISPDILSIKNHPEFIIYQCFEVRQGILGLTEQYLIFNNTSRRDVSLEEAIREGD